jgi:hypothetical protein
MKKFYRISGFLALTVFFFVLFSCRRILEQININTNGSEITGCRITGIDYPGPSAPVSLTFTYNASGDPVSIHPADETDLDAFSMDFHYSSGSTLSSASTNEYINGHGSTTYLYEGDKIDSSVFVHQEDDDERHNKYHYDGFHRVAGVTSDLYFLEYFQSRREFHYAYDVYGNLTGMGTFDEQTNLLRTKKIWMFLSRNYSINNPVGATSYNSAGLPEHFGTTTAKFINIPLSNATIHYECH